MNVIVFKYNCGNILSTDMPWPLDSKFKIPENEAVLAFIEAENPSAHSDIASVLTDSAKGIKDVRWYCPDPHAYAYVVLYTRDHRIFGIACGMNTVAFRLPEPLMDEALKAGGQTDPRIGPDWIAFDFTAPSHWCKAAHDYVLTV